MSYPTPSVRGPRPQEPADGERRAAPRHPSDAVISCHPVAVPPQNALPALVKDVSAGGISLVMKSRFAPGTLLSIDLGGLGGDATPLLGRVVHSYQRKDGKWLVGCALKKELTEQQLRACRPDEETDSWARVACAVGAGDDW